MEGLTEPVDARVGVGFTANVTLDVALINPLLAVTEIVYVVFELTEGAFCDRVELEPEKPAGLLVQL
ncbi:hypothetical protein GCM10028806_03870 [Spirosoma terrae]